MSTIVDFINGEFGLEKLQYLTSFDKLKHAKLPRPMQRRISETQLIVNVIEPGTPPEVMFNIFLRINTGGMTLNGQEIRHALYRGPVRDTFRDWQSPRAFFGPQFTPSSQPAWQTANVFFGSWRFTCPSPDQYTDNDLDKHLSVAMKTVNTMRDSQRSEIEGNFDKAMTAAYDIFGEDAFRKRSTPEHNRRAVSRALFEVWSVHLAQLDPGQIDAVVSDREKVKEKFMHLINIDRDFDRAISYGTGLPQRVHKRF